MNNLIPLEKITQENYQSRASKAFRISKTVEIILDTAKRKYFRVKGETEEHEVIYNKEKKDWACDCKFFSTKNQICAHILSVHIFLQK